MKILIYARVSTKDQNVEQQAAYCKEWAKRNGHEVVWTIKDKESGTLDLIKRRKFRMILDKEWNFEYDAVLVYHLDRLTRNWDDVTAVEKYFRENWDQCKLFSCMNDVDLKNASGRLAFRIQFAIYCNMPEDMREKQKPGIITAKQLGKYKGRKKGSKNKKYKKINTLKIPTTITLNKKDGSEVKVMGIKIIKKKERIIPKGLAKKIFI